jgi:hypothetical protein
MTMGKGLLLAAGFVGAVVLGIAIGPYVTNRAWMDLDRDRQASAPAASAVRDTESAPAKTRKARPASASSTGARTASETPASNTSAAVPANDPKLHARLKPVLNRGTKMEMAAEGFRDAEQFATVAHAARNTEVPFVVLKHRMLEEGQTLADAIRASKPDADVKAEVSRAREAAKSDIAAIAN